MSERIVGHPSMYSRPLEEWPDESELSYQIGDMHGEGLFPEPQPIPEPEPDPPTTDDSLKGKGMI